MAVVASLVFVGLQLKQSHAIAIASQYQARSDAASSHYTSLLQSETGLRLIGQGLLDDMLQNPALSPELKAWAAGQPLEDLAFRAIGATLFLKGNDNVYFQYQQGFLSEEAWQALRMQLKEGLADQRTWTRAIYEENPILWRQSYRELLDELIAELDAASPAKAAGGTQ